MAIFTWKVQVLVIDNREKGLNEYGNKDPFPLRIVVLVDDDEWFRCHYDDRSREWVETKSAFSKGLSRSAKPTIWGLLAWCLGSSASRNLTDKIAHRVQSHFDAEKDRATVEALRAEAEDDRG